MKKTFLLIILVAAIIGCSPAGPGSDALRNQANELYNSQKYEEALKIYQRALSMADGTDRLALRQDVIDCYQVLGRQAEARELLREQMQEAHNEGDRKMEAEALFTLGMQVYDTGDKTGGYNSMTNAVTIMEKSTDPDAPYLLAYYHYILTKRLADDGRHEDAIAHANAVETCLRQSEEPEKGKQMHVRTLSILASLYAAANQLAKADSVYALWQQFLPMPISSEREICPYLNSRGRYQEVLDIQKRYIEWVRENKGEWTAAERSSKYTMAEAAAALGRHEEAYNWLRESYEINDTLQVRQADVNAQELEAEYRSQLKTEQISNLRLWVIILGGALAALAIVTLVLRMRRIRRSKGRAIVEVARNFTAPIGQDNADAARFAAFDRTVEQGQLFTQPDLTREALAELMGVDRTTFSRIIREQSGCQNLSDYLNRKRIRKAEQLLREYPHYKIQAIMHDSGFVSKSVFIRLFRENYGVTPSEFRSSLN